jgi:hypothetical protein
MTEEEKQIAERYRGHYTKFALKTIYDIYDKYNNTKESKSCFCSGRKDSSIRFYNWYDSIVTNQEDGK